MKKTFLLSIFIGTLFTLSAQEIWIEAAAKGGYGVSFLYNSNIVNDDAYRYNITTTYGLGAKLAVNFGPYMGISIEGMYNDLGQEFEYDFAGVRNLNNTVEWKTVDTYLLYRYTRNRVFLELGPSYSFVQEVNQTDNGLDITEADQFYEKNYLTGVFGWGGYLTNAETFTLGIGMRLHWGLTNFVNDDGQALNFPAPTAVSTSDAITRPTFVQVLLEFNFGVGRFAKAQCSKRMQFFRARRR